MHRWAHHTISLYISMYVITAELLNFWWTFPFPIVHLRCTFLSKWYTQSIPFFFIWYTQSIPNLSKCTHKVYLSFSYGIHKVYLNFSNCTIWVHKSFSSITLLGYIYFHNEIKRLSLSEQPLLQHMQDLIYTVITYPIENQYSNRFM